MACCVGAAAFAGDPVPTLWHCSKCAAGAAATARGEVPVKPHLESQGGLGDMEEEWSIQLAGATSFPPVQGVGSQGTSVSSGHVQTPCHQRQGGGVGLINRWLRLGPLLPLRSS